MPQRAFFSSSAYFCPMNWIPLEQTAQLEDIVRQSHQHLQVIFKHSTRCSISSMAKARLERAGSPESVAFYYLDLLAFRSLSQQVAEMFHVHHESPQIILIKNGECIFDESHNGIRMEEITAFLD